jgi:hypothetical protein
MAATTIAIARPLLNGCSAGNSASHAASLLATVAPENAPARMPISVMPICTVGRNVPGASASASAERAPGTPARAMALSLALRAETTASSDIAKKPLSRIRARTMSASVYSIGGFPRIAPMVRPPPCRVHFRSGRRLASR